MLTDDRERLKRQLRDFMHDATEEELEAKTQEIYEKRRLEKLNKEDAADQKSDSTSAKPSSSQSNLKDISAVEKAILYLAACCDGAKTEDKTGFNKKDSKLGHQLADQIMGGHHLDDADAEKALRMVRKYENTQLIPAGIKLPSKSDKDTQAASLAAVALEGGNALWHTPEGVAFITISCDGHGENYALRSKDAKDWLSFKAYSADGKPPGSQAIQDALTALEGKALFEGEEHRVYVRVAPFQNRVYVDLGDETWEAIEISAEGWKLVSNTPVHFRRPKNMLPLPRPVKGGNWSSLRELLNAGDDKIWIQIVAWLIQAYWPHGPYAHLVLNGEQGCGKSKVTEILKSLVDPSIASLRRPPREERDLMVSAQSERILAYDNLSGLSKDLSDAFCCLSTGATLGKRALYTDSDESIMNAKRPCLLNGIDSIATRGDLLDRAIIANLASIPEAARRKDREIMAELERLHPFILGLILDATSMGLRRIGDIDIPNLPRMADFAEWVVACEPALPWEEGEFLTVYREARNDAMKSLFETDRFAQAVFRLVHAAGGNIEMTATELLEALNRKEGIIPGREPQGWPKAANKVTSRLRRVAPQLRAARVHWMELDRTGASRGIRIWIGDDSDDTQEVSSQSQPTENDSNDDMTINSYLNLKEIEEGAE